MRRYLTVLALCLPLSGEGQSIRKQETDYSLGATADGSIRYYRPIASSTLYDGLASCWNLNEASGDRADSAGTNTLSDTNTVAATDGKNANGARFVAASSQKLSVANNSTLESGGAFTVAFWARRTTNMVANGGLVGRWSGTMTSNSFVVYSQSTTAISGGVAVGGTPYLTAGLALSLDTWTLVVLSKPAAPSVATLYLGDGTTKASTSSGNAVNSGSVAFEIGAYAAAGTYNNIDIDEVCYWPDRELTSDERAELYAAGAGKFYPF